MRIRKFIVVHIPTATKLNNLQGMLRSLLSHIPYPGALHSRNGGRTLLFDIHLPPNQPLNSLA
jgi:hypothetical protein